MAHITSIGAALYSDLSVWVGESMTADATLPATPEVITNWITRFTTQAPADGEASAVGDIAAGKFARIEDVREFPAIGTPPNIVKVPVYGQATSKSIQGQADAPQLELTINYVPSRWASDTLLGKLVGDGVVHAFRFTLLNAKPGGYSSLSGTSGLGGDTSDATVAGNTQYFWLGKLEALLVKPSLTDATTATLTLSIQSDFYGAFTTATQTP
jgi:hypothetical protein